VISQGYLGYFKAVDCENLIYIMSRDDPPRTTSSNYATSHAIIMMTLSDLRKFAGHFGYCPPPLNTPLLYLIAYN